MRARHVLCTLFAGAILVTDAAAAADPVRYDWAGTITYTAKGSVHDEEVGTDHVYDASISQDGTITFSGAFNSGSSVPRPFDVYGGGGTFGWSTATWSDAHETFHSDETLSGCRTITDATYPAFRQGQLLLYAGIQTDEPSAVGRLTFGTLGTDETQPLLQGGVHRDACGTETDEANDHSPIGWLCGMTYTDGFGFDIPRSVQGTDSKGRPTIQGSVTVPCDADQTAGFPAGWTHGADGTTTLTFALVGIAQKSKDDDGPNHRPVAHADHWTVPAGHTLDANLLANDTDADGDPLHAHVVKISFAAREYSRVERGGDFLYTAGPGTQRTLRKVITYVAIDSHGARSEPAKATIRLTVPRRGAPPPPRVARAAAAWPRWTTPSNGFAWLCFYPGLKTKCFYMLSIATAAQFNRQTSWVPSLSSAAQLCLKYGILPMKNAQCAQKLFSAGVSGLWDVGSIADAANAGGCLLYRVTRHRTFSHPFAGEWGKPEYHPIDSTVRPYDAANPRTTGYARWKKPGATITRQRIPLFCRSDGTVTAGVGGYITDE